MAKTTLAVMAFVTFAGGLATVASHYSRRSGVPRWTTASTFPWKYFNWKEWLLLILTFLVSLSLFVISLRFESP